MLLVSVPKLQFSAVCNLRCLGSPGKFFTLSLFCRVCYSFIPWWNSSGSSVLWQHEIRLATQLYRNASL